MKLFLSVDKKTNLSLWNTKPDPCVESARVHSFYWCEFFPVFGMDMENYRVSPRIHSEYGEVGLKSILNANKFHAVDIRTLLRCFDTTVL